MRRRSAVLVVLSICYFIAPFAVLLQRSISSRLPLFGPDNLFEAGRTVSVLVLALYPVGGVGLLAGRRWGWHMFIGCAVALIGFHAGSLVLNPGFDLLGIVIANIALVTLSSLFLHTHALAPRFRPRHRWWETGRRYRVEATAGMKVGEAIVTGEILDISRSGCFATFILDLPIGETYRMHVKCLRHSLDLDGKIVRKAGRSEPREGYGVMFVKPTREQQLKIDGIIEELERGGMRDYIRDQEMIPAGIVENALYSGVTRTEPRYNVWSSAVLASAHEAYLCRIVDISDTGCYVQTERTFAEGSVFLVKINCMKMKITLEGRIERMVSIDGSKGYGIRFVGLTKQKRGELESLLAVLRKVGARERDLPDPPPGA